MQDKHVLTNLILSLSLSLFYYSVHITEIDLSTYMYIKCIMIDRMIESMSAMSLSVPSHISNRSLTAVRQIILIELIAFIHN